MNNNTPPKKAPSFITDNLTLLKRLFRIRSIPLILCLIIDGLFLWFGVAIVFGISSEFLPKFLYRNDGLIVTLVTIALYVITIGLSFTELGDTILRNQHNCTPITDKAILARIEPIFNEVYEKTKKIAPHINDSIKLFICEDDCPNAFAMGRRTVCLTTGMLDETDEHIRGVLAHEFGHLAHKDTDLALIVNIAGMFQNIVLLGAHALILIVKVFFSIFSLIAGLALGSEASAVGKIFDMILGGISLVFITFFRKLWSFICVLSVNLSGREEEYRADEFALNAGYGENLINYFETLPDSQNGSKRKLARFFSSVANFGGTHPLTWKRIERLNKKMNSSVAISHITDGEIEEIEEISTTVKE